MNFRETLAFTLIAIAVFSLITITAIQSIILLVDDVPIIVKVEGKTVYEGSSAKISTESNGANTKVCIKGGFLYLFPQKYYINKDIVIEGKKGD